MLKNYFFKIKQELEEELEIIEHNYHNGEYKTQQEKEICTEARLRRTAIKKGKFRSI